MAGRYHKQQTNKQISLSSDTPPVLHDTSHTNVALHISVCVCAHNQTHSPSHVNKRLSLSNISVECALLQCWSISCPAGAAQINKHKMGDDTCSHTFVLPISQHNCFNTLSALPGRHLGGGGPSLPSGSYCYTYTAHQRHGFVFLLIEIWFFLLTVTSHKMV